ncbi:Acyl-coenzyme A:6-aminopenicillanic acid acyl-transferase [Lentzea jiangxiensis]|uniref:Acyl-coenzyme A:6-aminopenicillanic acid acyl-transferase n=1 Tax=Lentzea jiangxiensis TaxID=641025 RepID=A0A1H0X660_9PSEU|nr:Acyl-coenzyme A:6-aminopenicillanic acid acyl-transferase [Lentzea jiangxiensis]
MTDRDHRSTTFRAFVEERPGEQWREHVRRHWPRLRPSEVDDSFTMAWRTAVLGLSVPALGAMSAELAAAAELDDLALTAFLTHVGPPRPEVTGRQVTGGSTLVRNLDADVTRHEWTLWQSKLGRRRVMGTTSGLWGLLDGINEDGLVVSLNSDREARHDEATYGLSGPLLVRHLLEHCAVVRDVDEALTGWRTATTHDISVVDAAGDRAAYRVQPNNLTLRGRTQHWDTSFEAVSAMLSAPRYRTSSTLGVRTLHTAVYLPAKGSVTLLWPNEIRSWTFDVFEPAEIEVPHRADLTP